MRCGRVALCDRRDARLPRPGCGERSRRYCERRLVDPTHEEDPRWTHDALERFRCDHSEGKSDGLVMPDSPTNESIGENDLVLTVLNITFPGHHSKSKNNRSCFKYKMPSTELNQNPHRMFVKQIVDYEFDSNSIDDGSSQADCKFHEYVTDILNENDFSRPSTPLSETFYQNPIVQHPQQHATETESKETCVKATETAKVTEETHFVEATTTVTYQSAGKRRSLTISRAQSPETVQVIRVDVVCNYSGRSSPSSNISGSKSLKPDISTGLEAKGNLTRSSLEGIKLRSPFVNRYILTNSIKQLDQNVGSGEKVTLLCKTFKLTARSQKPKGILMEEGGKKSVCRKEKKNNKKSLKLVSNTN